MERNFDEEILVAQKVDPNFDEPILNQVLRIAVYDEYHAYEVYKKVLETFGNVTPFANIMEAEINHYNAMEFLCNKYSVPLPINDWAGKIEVPVTLVECCELGVAAEIKNIKMYDDLLPYANEFPDVEDALFRLQAASYNNHLPAFRQCVVNYTSQNNQMVNPMTDVNNFDSEEMMNKVNEFGEIAQKFASGQMSNDELMGVLSKTNMSFLGGILLGGVGSGILSNMMKEKEGE
ncbi:MAG: DUF2202 domain-containing protein [Campylobacterales bacterium]|nr:DUF2202 domain-containing protein [Campylobacterales bacterium]